MPAVIARHHISSAWAACLVAASFGLTQGVYAEANKQSTFRVRTVDRGSLAGYVESLSLAKGLVLIRPESDALRLAARDLVQIDTPVAPVEPEEGSVRWRLTNGDVLFGKLLEGDERSVAVAVEGIEPLRLRLTDLRGLIAGSPDGAETDSTHLAAVPPRNVRDDVVRLANGDRLTGLILRIDPKGVTLEESGNETTVAWDVIASVGLARIGTEPKPKDGPSGLRARLLHRNGSAITVDHTQWRTEGIEFTPEWAESDQRYRVARGRICRIEVLGGRWQWLSQRPPARAEHLPIFDLSWPHRRNRNVLGDPLRVGGRTFERGLGVHSRTLLSWKLDPGCTRFVARYAMDDDSGPLANVDVIVRLDGKEVHEDQDLGADGEVRALSLDLNGAKELELLVDYGKNGHVQDRFDWIEPAIIRE